MSDRQKLRSVAVTIAAIGVKSAKIVSILKLVKFTKIILTASTMAVSALAYGFAFGPIFAVGLMSMLFIHEMGHVMAMWRKGLKTSPPVFIPFLGAMIFVRSFGDRETEAYVGYGGPLVGSIAAFLCLLAWIGTGSNLLLLTAFLGLYLNLFNLIPLQPLDGGRIGQVMGKGIAYAAIAFLIGYTFYIKEPALLLIWVFALQEASHLPLWWRPGISVMLTLVMSLLFLDGHSIQIWWVNILDVLMATGWTALFITMEYARAGQERRGMYWQSDDPRPYPPIRTRLSWLAIYTSSVIALWGALWYLLDYLPQ